MSKLKLAIPTINNSDVWGVDFTEKVSACDNRPGLKMIYVTVVDKTGHRLPWIKVRFDSEPVWGVVSDQPNWTGHTDDKGCVVWDHPGTPARYRLYMEDEPFPLLVNIRTDLPRQYCKQGNWLAQARGRPFNRPGIFSYRIKVRRRY